MTAVIIATSLKYGAFHSIMDTTGFILIFLNLRAALLPSTAENNPLQLQADYFDSLFLNEHFSLA